MRSYKFHSPSVTRRHCRLISSRRGVVVVFVAALLIVIMGFTVLAVDVGYMYNARAELQRAADASVMAAAAFLSSGSPLDADADVRAQAAIYAALNEAAGEANMIDQEADVVLGRASLNPNTGKYSFSPSVYPWDAVKVTVRRTSDSASGPISLFFAGFFGSPDTDVSASATAVLVPRDIAMVVDLSGSMNDDSELGSYRESAINLTDVWKDLTPGSSGPTWGNMVVWGTEEIDPDTYQPSNDPGLTRMPYRSSWSYLDVNNDGVNDFNQLTSTYNSREIGALKSGSYDSYRSMDYYADRVAVMLRLADWNDNDRDRKIDSYEVSWIVPYPYNEGTWRDWIKNYVRSSSTQMYYANSDFRYRFGLKTFVNYLLERREANYESPILAQSPCQPLEAVKDAIDHCLTVIDDLDSNDQMSLEIYATDARHQIDLTEDYHQVASRLDEMQAGHYNSWTCIGGGIEKAIEELESERSRGYAKKVILLMTDGRANVDEWGRAGYQYESYARAYALAQAEEAAERGYIIYSISVGFGADRGLMQEIAAIGNGEEFFTSADSSAEYTAQLMEIFGRLGGKRPVALID